MSKICTVTVYGRYHKKAFVIDEWVKKERIESERGGGGEFIGSFGALI